MFVATMETQNFDFVAVGETAAHATAAIRAGFAAHLRVCGDTLEDWENREGDLNENYGIAVLDIGFGECLRDGSPIIGFKRVGAGASEKVTRTKPTEPSIEDLAKDAYPINDDEWGSERQVTAENRFFMECQRIDPVTFAEDSDFSVWCLKATSDEMIDYALELLKVRTK